MATENSPEASGHSQQTLTGLFGALLVSQERVRRKLGCRKTMAIRGPCRDDHVPGAGPMGEDSQF